MPQRLLRLISPLLCVSLELITMAVAGFFMALASAAPPATPPPTSAPVAFANLTTYHVNPLSAGSVPFNMDTGGVSGDLYFVLRSVVSPIECAADPAAEDCTDAEVIDPALVATQLRLEVDPRFGRYGMCNICTPATANSSLGRDCTPALYGKYLCEGALLDRRKVGHETVASAHRAACGASDPEWACWRAHLVGKIPGDWYSFFNESYCADGGDGHGGGGGGGGALGVDCAWRVGEVQKTVNNTCLLDRVYGAIEGYAPTANCFAQCTAGAGAGRNASDPCWVRCTYAAVLGPGGGSPAGNITGMPLSDIEAGWNLAFAKGADEGGCDAV